MLINLDIISCFSQTVHLCCTFPDRQLPEKVQQLSLLLVFKTTNCTFFLTFSDNSVDNRRRKSRLWSLRAVRTFRVKDVASLAECPRPVCRATLTTADFLSAGANSYFRWFLKSPYKTGLYNNNCQKKKEGPLRQRRFRIISWTDLRNLTCWKAISLFFFFLIKLTTKIIKRRSNFHFFVFLDKLLIIND